MKFQHNNHVHFTTQQPPFLLDTGQIPHMGFELRQNPSSLEMVNEFTKRMESTTKEAKSTIHKAQEDMTRYYNRRRSPAPVFKPGDQVYLDTVTNFIQPYLHQFFIDSHGLNSYRKPLKRPFNRY